MHVIRPWLFLGKYRDILNFPLLESHKIGAMLQFAEQVEYPNISTLYLPVEDGTVFAKEVFEQGINFITSNYRQGNNVLISCGAGISRSVTFTIAALKETENLKLLDAYQIILHAHPGALPHPILWKSLCAYYQEDTPYWLLLKKYNQTNS